MTWDSKPEDCPKVFNIHSEICDGCAQKTECLQAMMGDKLDQYIRVQEKSLEKAEEWVKEQKEKEQGGLVAGPRAVTGRFYKKRDKKDIINEFLTDFCDFIGILNNCLAAAGITLDVPDQISLFMQYKAYESQNLYNLEEKP